MLNGTLQGKEKECGRVNLIKNTIMFLDAKKMKMDLNTNQFSMNQTPNSVIMHQLKRNLMNI